MLLDKVTKVGQDFEFVRVGIQAVQLPLTDLAAADPMVLLQWVNSDTETLDGTKPYIGGELNLLGWLLLLG